MAGALNNSCRVCGSTRLKPLGAPARRLPAFVAGVPVRLDDLQQQLMHCCDCDYLFIEPCIPVERLLDCYRRSLGDHWPTDETVAARRCYDVKRDLICRYLQPGGRVLDFGCYDGGFLQYVGDTYDRWGIEPSAAAREKAAARGIKILAETIEEVDPSQSVRFDVIVTIDVMEHLADPVDSLRRLARLLKPGGVIIAETGNYDAPAFRKLGPLYYYVAIPEHVGFFSHKSIAEAAGRAGLHLVEFHKSAHSRAPQSRVAAFVNNTAYWMLRLAMRMHAPLPPRLQNIASGPVPRHPDQMDHFLAVMRRVE